MARAGQQEQDVTLGNGGVVEGELPGYGTGQDLTGSVVTQGLLDPQWHARRVDIDRRQLVLVLVSPKSSVSKEFGGGLVAGDHHQEHETEYFVIGEPVAVDLGF